ncbi:hypothetical protein B0H66DRAFT_550004 [Apodospora peruviana]|uniref:F-box domain-containing protein n=1 Tax=Apodospora peruviana TaxID=516989 RepID=A0AAE0IJE8_9PEZI|nr:hypothetical protein B0H66DRAFT_550004 [Apodospora peruviana]
MASVSSPVNPQADSHLTKVPIEIVDRITKYISTKDLGNVRLSCRGLENATFPFFSREFFTKKQFMGYTISLQALVDIANHETLAPCLKHVILSTDRFEGRGYHSFQGIRLDDAQYQALQLARADHENLMAAGGLRDMLVEAFSKLPNLKTVDIRDFNSRSRTRDGGQWTSWGSTTLTEAIGFEPAPRPGPGLGVQFWINYPSQLFSAVTAALAASQARPESIELVLRSSSVSDHAFFIPQRILPSLIPVLSGLKQLHLVLAPHSPLNNSNIGKFLQHTPNLTWLRLNFQSTLNPENSENLFARLSRSDADNANHITLQHLEQLDLGSLTINPKVLVHLVASFAPNLRTLSFRRVKLVGRAEDHNNTDINTWAKLFSKLALVDGLDIRKLQVSHLDHGFGPVSFGAKRSGYRQGAVLEQTYEGQSTQDVVAQVVADVTPFWPHLPDDDEDEDEDDSLADDDEDNDENDDEADGDGDGMAINDDQADNDHQGEDDEMQDEDIVE